MTSYFEMESLYCRMQGSVEELDVHVYNVRVQQRSCKWKLNAAQQFHEYQQNKLQPFTSNH